MVVDVWAGVDYEVADAIRWVDIIIGSLLVLGLIYEFFFHYLSKPKPHATLCAVSSWFLINLAASLTSYLRLGEPPDAALPIRLLGHAFGLVFVCVAFTMRRQGGRPLRDVDDR